MAVMKLSPPSGAWRIARRALPGLAAVTLLAGCASPATASPAPTPFQIACATSIAVLTDDLTLDTAAADTVPDPTQYLAYVVHEKAAIAYVTADCAGHPPTTAQRISTEQWLDVVIASHVNDIPTHPSSRPWDRLWIARYDALMTFLSSSRPKP